MLTPWQRILVGVFVGALYLTQSIARGDLVPGIVGGVLAAILTALVLQRYQERKAAVQRAREQRSAE